ncbi:NSs [Weldona virus]|nr:NSs [Weldona virus]
MIWSFLVQPGTVLYLTLELDTKILSIIMGKVSRCSITLTPSCSTPSEPRISLVANHERKLHLNLVLGRSLLSIIIIKPTLKILLSQTILPSDESAAILPDSCSVPIRTLSTRKR